MTIENRREAHSGKEITFEALNPKHVGSQNVEKGIHNDTYAFHTPRSGYPSERHQPSQWS